MCLGPVLCKVLGFPYLSLRGIDYRSVHPSKGPIGAIWENMRRFRITLSVMRCSHKDRLLGFKMELSPHLRLTPEQEPLGAVSASTVDGSAPSRSLVSPVKIPGE